MTPAARVAVLPAPAGELRRPGTAARFLLFLLAASSLAVLFTIAFPPGVPDRLPILAMTLLLALTAARRPEAGVCAFALLLPLSGLLARAFGGTDAAAWPVLLFAGLATGWCFRFLYDFESKSDSSRVDGALRALTLLWALATLLSLLRARTLWALTRGLSGRLVNGDGMAEAAAAQESLMSFAALGAGAAFFFLLRRSGGEARSNAAAAAAAGTALSGFVAVLEAAGALPWPTREFWRFTGRVSGGAVDPNTLGMLGALAIPLLATLAARARGVGRVAWGAGLFFAAAGILLSGSRSALLVLIVAAGAAVCGMFARRARGAILLATAMAVILVAGIFALPGRGGLGARLLATFDASKSAGDRLSSRPLLWSSAIAEFREDPVEGGGLGSFAWRLPDLAGTGERFRMRDNPGSAYLQALAETGLVGFALTIWLVIAAAVIAVRAILRGPAPAAAAGLSVLGFFAALTVGSHWLGADAGLVFFLLLALCAGARIAPEPRAAKAGRLLLIAAWTIAAAAAVAKTAHADAAFRHGNRIGFHDLEKTEGGSFRWTRESFAIRLAPGERRRLGLAHFPPDARSVEIEASGGGRVLFRRSLPPGEGVTLTLSAPALEGAEIVFRLSRSFVPRRLGMSQDRRRLGVMTTGI